MGTYSNGSERLKGLPRRSVLFTCFQIVVLTQPVKIYAGLSFKISISFPPNYPYVAPTIKFDTPCYHPNVDINGGAICLDILQVRTCWSSTLTRNLRFGTG